MVTIIQEIFSSVQGEGPYVGRRQVFVRFTGCNLSCTYCDTDTTEAVTRFRLEQTPGLRDFIYLTNPCTPKEIAAYLNAYYPLPMHHSISLTGGEPLLHTDFIKELIPLVKKTQKGIFLETNGTLPQALDKVLDLIDIISMDMKLPDVTGGRSYWPEHEQFLRLAVHKDVYVKVIIGAQTQFADLCQAAGIVAGIDPAIPLILQPVTPYGGVEKAGPDQLLKYQVDLLTLLKDVRVIPQTHRMMDQL